jgi:predicted deacetylase
MIVTVDDLCLSYLDNFKYFDAIKKKQPKFKVIAFTIANFKNKEPLNKSKQFKNWFTKHKDWVEIAVHSYDHLPPPDGDRKNEAYWIKKALSSLMPFLPKRYGYRSPGWQTTNKTVPILERLGFSYIAYQYKIKDLKKKKILDYKVINSHLYNVESIKEVENEISGNNFTKGQ